MSAPKLIPFLPSPHYSARPEQAVIDMIVLHAISLPDGHFSTQYVFDLFQGNLDHQAQPNLAALQDVQVSAHFVVARNGEITQFVHTPQRAWHAGESSWQGKHDCNDYSIGIEMIGDERQSFSQQQYTETARLCRCLMQKHPQIQQNRIIGHQDVAPTRKWDPGKQWSWAKFSRSFAHIQQQNLTFDRPSI
ncbi:MAG: 1,6-anhydro-N-acetylmuramyl-L-alanine amidase AmpD [Mariprofundaceae bacterium]|nr:1,6-anhydro-N-acetylmuramyl-L-alanine amidase AmpD [Mariprofundaceae bacterium]